MKKVSIIAPVFYKVNRIPETMHGLVDLFKDKYDFEVLYYYAGKLPANLDNDHRFNFFEVSKDVNFDDCATSGFEIATGDCVVVADLDNVNYKDYIIKLLVEWEAKAQVVLVKKQKKTDGFWNRIGNFFSNLCGKIYDLFIGSAGLNADFKACRNFQLFSREVVDVIKEFPEKNYYLRNFDCWVDFRVSVLHTDEKISVKNTKKVFNSDFICALSSFVLAICMILFVSLTTKFVNAQNKATFILIGIGVILALVIFSLYNLYYFLLERCTHLKQNTNK